jgi:proline dehydrogenase
VGKVLKNAFLFMAQSRSANKLARHYGLRLGARRFVAGESIEAAIDATKALNSRGIEVTLDHLGEFVSGNDEARLAARYCIDTLEAVRRSGVRARLSIKLTQLGLDIDKALCEENVRLILDKAVELDNFVRIDMENFQHNQDTINIYRQVHQVYAGHLGLVIQANLFKSKNDIADLESEGANLRIVKGAYQESPSVAFRTKNEIDANFLELLKLHLASGNFTAIATHDEGIIGPIKNFIDTHRIPRDQFEFQMLYGLRPDVADHLVHEGYAVRIYIPFGDDWFAYFMRRLAERPANAHFILKSFKRPSST